MCTPLDFGTLSDEYGGSTASQAPTPHYVRRIWTSKLRRRILIISSIRQREKKTVCGLVNRKINGSLGTFIMFPGCRFWLKLSPYEDAPSSSGCIFFTARKASSATFSIKAMSSSVSAALIKWFHRPLFWQNPRTGIYPCSIWAPFIKTATYPPVTIVHITTIYHVLLQIEVTYDPL